MIKKNLLNDILTSLNSAENSLSSLIKIADTPDETEKIKNTARCIACGKKCLEKINGSF